MKKIILSAVMLLMGFLTGNLFGQSLQMFFTEPSGYPYMTTGFKLFDAQGNEIRNSPTLKPIKKGNIVIYETSNYGTTVQREVLADPDCPEQTLTTFSAVLIVDISESMNMDENRLSDGSLRIDAAKEVLKEWARSFDPKRTETAITAFCGDAMASTRFPDGPVRTFTTDKDSLFLAIDEMPDRCSGTNYNAAFLHKRMETFIKHYSALYWCQPSKAKYKPVIIFLTDGNHLPNWGGTANAGAFNIDEVIRLANERNTTIYVIVFGDDEINSTNQEHLIQLSYVGKAGDDTSPNIWWNINSANELKGIYQEILNEAGRLGDPPPCYIPWKGGCEGGSATFTFVGAGPGGTDLVGVSDYILPPAKLPNLSINPRKPVFSNVPPGSSASMTITLKAEKNFVEIDGIDILDPSLVGDFSVIDWGPMAPPPFVIQKDSTYNIVIQYAPQDSSCSKGYVEFLGSACTGRLMEVKAEMLPFVEDIDMGNVNVGGNKSETFTQVFCNKTCQVINITARPKTTGTDASNFTVLKPTGAATLQPGECLEMEFKFAPTEPAGTKKAKIEIKIDYNNQTFNGNITGNAVGGKTVVHTDPGFDSASCTNTNIENIIVLENAGVETINGITCSIVPDEANFEIKNDLWPTTLAGGATGEVTIIFHPTNPAKQNADYTATLRVVSDAENSPYDIPLVGPMRNIDFTLSAPVDFQEVCVGSPETRQVTLTNTGNVPLNVNASANAPFSPANATYNVPVGGNVTIDVECNPLTDGAFSSNLTITNTECSLTETVALSAMGVEPTISFDKQVTLAATVGGIDEIDIVVTNESASPVTITNIEPCDDVRFAITNINPSPLPQTIQASGNISFKVTYTPQAGDDVLLNTCIHFTGSTCNLDTNVAITGNPGTATVHIEIDEYTGYDGDAIDIDLFLRNGDRFDESNTTRVSTQIRYDGSLLEAQPEFNVTNDVGTFKIINLTDKTVSPINTQQLVETLKFNIRKVGTATMTALEILNTTGNGGAGFIPDNGLFTLSEAAAIVSIDTVADYTGREVKFKVRLITNNPLPGDNTDKITLRLITDGTVLEPINKAPLKNRSFNKTTMKWTALYELPITPTSGNVLGELSFNSMLGMKSEVILLIDSVAARGSLLEPGHGLFTVLDLCKDGNDDNTRFFNPVGKAAILSMNPNPTDGMINIEYETQEKGFTKMWVTDMLGNHVYDLYSGVPSPGKADVNLDGTRLSNGVYFIVLQTPTQVIREKIYIMR